MKVNVLQKVNYHVTRWFPRCISSIYRTGGIRGLYTGWGPAVQRAMLVQIGDLTTYDQTKQMFQRQPFEVQDGPILHGLSSAVAGLVAATLGAPADVVKTRIMNQPLDPYV